MKVVLAPDKFRGSLTAHQAALAMQRGVLSVDAAATTAVVPLADGGEGTLDALVAATSGQFRQAIVAGPLGKPVSARWGILGDGTTAVLEMAEASGLALVPRQQRDPKRTTTRGTGELILAAIEAGCHRIILGIGGSATNDGGAGMAQALGYRLLDGRGEELAPGGGSLDQLVKIDGGTRHPALDGLTIDVACDVDNPLCGPQGASAVYGPQKGASPETVAGLDKNLAHFASVIERDLARQVSEVPGAGAAGGLGAGLLAFTSGRLRPGIVLVLEAVGISAHLEGADLCLTGEGALDASSAHGKTAVGVARLARSLGCPTIALAGTIGPGAGAVLDQGIIAYFSICPGPISLEQSLARAPALLEQAAAQALRCFLAGGRAREVLPP